MAKFIIEGKIFDTEAAESIIEYRKGYPVQIFGSTYYIKRKTTLYKTSKGNWFSVSEEDYGRLTGHSESEASVREILKQLNAIEIYNNHFEALEEV